MTLGVYWEGARIGELERTDGRTREYGFRYLNADRPISLSLPLRAEAFSYADSRPFFEGLLPEGVVREQIARALKLTSDDSYGLLSALGRDCAGALQIVDVKRMSDTPSVRWLLDEELDRLIQELPRHPLGVMQADERMRLSLAGAQRKLVLVRGADGRFGQPLDGMPSTHILKPESDRSDYPDIACNEFFCMRLAQLCGLTAAPVALILANGRNCVVVERFDRDIAVAPARRLHQEDLCQALGLISTLKYQREDWDQPSYAGLARLLDEYSPRPGADRLSAARAVVFNFLVANADAHAKNISLLHRPDGVRLAPLYDVVSTGVYPDLDRNLALKIGATLDPDAVGVADWSDLAFDLGLSAAAFERERKRLATTVVSSAETLAAQAHADGWHRPVIDQIVALIRARTAGL